jgi:hypothetical protein
MGRRLPVSFKARKCNEGRGMFADFWEGYSTDLRYCGVKGKETNFTSLFSFSFRVTFHFILVFSASVLIKLQCDVRHHKGSEQECNIGHHCCLGEDR